MKRFPLSTFFAASFALVMAYLVVSLAPNAPWVSPARGIAGVLAAMAAVAAEALWRGRPWAYRASAALALAHAVAVLGFAALASGMFGVQVALAYLFASAFVVVPILASVYQGTISWHGVPPRRRPVPSPSSPPNP